MRSKADRNISRTFQIVGSMVSVDESGGPFTSVIFHCIMSPCLKSLGTEFVVKRYKTLHNVERAAAEGRMPHST